METRYTRPSPFAYAEPHHPGSISRRQMFQPRYVSKEWHSRQFQDEHLAPLKETALTVVGA